MHRTRPTDTSVAAPPRPFTRTNAATTKPGGSKVQGDKTDRVEPMPDYEAIVEFSPEDRRTLPEEFDALFDSFRSVSFAWRPYRPMQGRRTTRCTPSTRLVDEPRTEFQRYQLEPYRELQAAGEQIRIVTCWSSPTAPPRT